MRRWARRGRWEKKPRIADRETPRLNGVDANAHAGGEGPMRNRSNRRPRASREASRVHILGTKEEYLFADRFVTRALPQD